MLVQSEPVMDSDPRFCASLALGRRAAIQSRPSPTNANVAGEGPDAAASMFSRTSSRIVPPSSDSSPVCQKRSTASVTFTQSERLALCKALWSALESLNSKVSRCDGRARQQSVIAGLRTLLVCRLVNVKGEVDGSHNSRERVSSTRPQ